MSSSLIGSEAFVLINSMALCKRSGLPESFATRGMTEKHRKLW